MGKCTRSYQESHGWVTDKITDNLCKYTRPHQQSHRWATDKITDNLCKYTRSYQQSHGWATDKITDNNLITWVNALAHIRNYMDG